MENIEYSESDDNNTIDDYKYLLRDLLQCKEISQEDYDEMIKTYKIFKKRPLSKSN